MSDTLEIRRLIRKINDARNDVNRYKSSMMQEVYNVPSWWKGSASNAFVNQYYGTDQDINVLLKHLDDLHTKAQKMLDAIEEAEMEREMAARWVVE